MSRPGDKGRRLITADGFDQIIVKAVELVGTVPGASEFEIGYEPADGRELGEDEDTLPDEPVRWYARATIKRGNGRKRLVHTYEGSHVADPVAQTPPGGHQQAGVLAVVDLLERIGVNVIVLDQLRNPQ